MQPNHIDGTVQFQVPTSEITIGLFNRIRANTLRSLLTISIPTGIEGRAGEKNSITKQVPTIYAKYKSLETSKFQRINRIIEHLRVDEEERRMGFKTIFMVSFSIVQTTLIAKFILVKKCRFMAHLKLDNFV